MENDSTPASPIYPQMESQSFFTKYKKWIVVVLGFLVIGIIVVFVIVAGIANQNDSSTAGITPSPTPGLMAPDATQAAKDVQVTTRELIDVINSKEVTQAVENYTTAVTEPDKKDTLIKFYEEERRIFSDDGVYNPVPVENGLQVYGIKAQMLLEEQIEGKTVQIRRDLVYTNNGWKIEDTKYNKPLDLKEQHEAQLLEYDLLKNATYEERPSTYTLPNGDVLEIFRTDWYTNANPYDNTELLENTTFSDVGKYDFVSFQDFIFLLSNTKQDYTVVLFDAPYPRKVKTIRKGTTSGNYGPYQSFDIREVVEDDGKAVLLVYEGVRDINKRAPGIPGGWVLSIPIAITHYQEQ